MKTDQEKLDEVTRQLAEATDGDTVARLRARRDVLQERVGYSFSGAPNRQHGLPHIWDEVKHPRLKGKFKTKLAQLQQRRGSPAPTDPQSLDHHPGDEFEDRHGQGWRLKATHAIDSHEMEKIGEIKYGSQVTKLMSRRELSPNGPLGMKKKRRA